MALLAGCPKPADKFEDFIKRQPVYDLTMPDGPSGTIADVSGDFFLAISTTLGPDQPLLFVSTNKLTAQMDGTAKLDMSIQPLTVKDRMKVGPPIVVKDLPVSANGQFRADLGVQMVAGAANPISGSDITATLILVGTIFSKDRMCGAIEGKVSMPVKQDLAGSTWGAIRVAPGTIGAALPKAESKCQGGVTDGGLLTDGGVDGGDGGGVVAVEPRLSLSALSGKVPLPMGDGGVQLVTTQILSPSPGVPPKGFVHDFDDRNGGLFGCYADFWDTAKGKLPPKDGDAGTITMTGYKTAKLVTGMAAPGEINCALVGGYYKCGFGPLSGGMPSALSASTPFAPGESPLAVGTNVVFRGTGGTAVNMFDSGKDALAGESIKVMADLDTIKYDPTKDQEFSFTCDDGPCTLAAVVTLATSQKTPDKIGEDSTRFGTLTCSGFGAGGKMSVKQGAIASVFGCDKMGKGCDATIQSVRTVVVRFPSRVDIEDKGAKNIITVLVGRGIFGVAKK